MTRPTYDNAGNQKVPLKKDEHGNDVPQTRNATPNQSKTGKEQR